MNCCCCFCFFISFHPSSPRTPTTTATVTISKTFGVDVFPVSFSMTKPSQFRVWKENMKQLKLTKPQFIAWHRWPVKPNAHLHILVDRETWTHVPPLRQSRLLSHVKIIVWLLNVKMLRYIRRAVNYQYSLWWPHTHTGVMNNKSAKRRCGESGIIEDQPDICFPWSTKCIYKWSAQLTHRRHICRHSDTLLWYSQSFVY